MPPMPALLRSLLAASLLAPVAAGAAGLVTHAERSGFTETGLVIR